MNRPPEEQQRTGDGKKPKRRAFGAGDREKIYEFTDSNIKERHGYYPLWLTIVAIVLVLWSVWYTYEYWGPQ